ncbi:armadillo-type protein [Mycena sanguinolenta]|nr:armadillo-type protein [Mycena sanguinolenta]
MQPLTRQQSRTSIFSWWSDRNPGLRGPTINLHAATKPLLRFMYHFQAVGFIQKNCFAALSTESLNVLSSYLGSKYVGHATKVVVLQELDKNLRSHRIESGRVMIDDPVGLQLVVEMLESPFPEIRSLTCSILGRLAGHDSTMATALCNFGAKLAPLFRDEDEKVVENAMLAFFAAFRCPGGAEAFIDANLSDNMTELLESPRPFVRTQACAKLGQVVSAKSTALSIFGIKLVPLIHDEDDTIVNNVVRAFCVAVGSPDGAQAFIDAKLLDSVSELLESPRPFVRTQACTILGHLAIAKSTALSNFGAKLVPLVRDEDDTIAEKAMWAFSVAAHFPNGAQAFIDAKLLDRVPELLESSRPFVRTQACRLVGMLASHVETTTAVLKSKPCPRLVVLLRDEDIYVVHAALYALTQLSKTFPGAKAVRDAKALQYVPRLLGPETMVQERSHQLPQTNMVQARCYELLESLFRHQFAVPAILRLNICTRLVSILQSAKLPPFAYKFHESDSTSLTVVATSLLARMSEWPGGVSAVAETAVLDVIERINCDLALPLDSRVRADMRTIQDNIARYKDD